jgi:hypothetical protein
MELVLRIHGLRLQVPDLADYCEANAKMVF